MSIKDVHAWLDLWQAYDYWQNRPAQGCACMAWSLYMHGLIFDKHMTTGSSRMCLHASQTCRTTRGPTAGAPSKCTKCCRQVYLEGGALQAEQGCGAWSDIYRVGQNYIYTMYNGIFGRVITKYTVMYGVYIRSCTVCLYGHVRCIYTVMYGVFIRSCTVCLYGHVRCI
jgi:hypothetical protein